MWGKVIIALIVIGAIGVTYYYGVDMVVSKVWSLTKNAGSYAIDKVFGEDQPVDVPIDPIASNLTSNSSIPAGGLVINL